jgi:major membrane immunogen (membrane-anchored lipoprotein)
MNGIVLKSAAYSGVIMTRCMIKKDFFNNGNYQIEIRNDDDKKRDFEKEQGLGKPIIEFCLPFAELK